MIQKLVKSIKKMTQNDLPGGHSADSKKKIPTVATSKVGGKKF